MLDATLQEVDGEEHSFYAQYNALSTIKNVVVLFDDDIAIACGAFKQFNEHTVEIKRMFTHPTHRGKQAATSVLTELENWATELNYTNAILETGVNLTNAIALYTKNGYTKRANYGQYIGVDNSICFQKSFP